MSRDATPWSHQARADHDRRQTVAADWISIKARWDLTVMPEECAGLSQMLDTCDDPRQLQAAK